MIEMDNISFRTAVLERITQFETSEGRGMTFSELVYWFTETKRQTVQKALDSLFDANLITTAWGEIDGRWKRFIGIVPHSKEFVDTALQNIRAKCGTEGKGE